jgi:hypothetical protein
LLFGVYVTRISKHSSYFPTTSPCPDASLPSTGSSRALVPPFPRYYQGTTTPAALPAALRCLRLAVPREHSHFRSLGGRGVRPCRAWSWSPGISRREFFRGVGRFSQVPGEPQYPFAHVLRPRPADASLTTSRTLAWPPYREKRRRRRELDFRGSIAWLPGSLPTYHVTVSRLTAQGSLPGAGQALLGGLSPAGLQRKVSNSLHVRCPPFPSFLARSPFRGPPFRGPRSETGMQLSVALQLDDGGVPGTEFGGQHTELSTDRARRRSPDLAGRPTEGLHGLRRSSVGASALFRRPAHIA